MATTRVLRAAAALLCAGAIAPSQSDGAAPDSRPLRVAFVGDAESERSAAFARFLMRRFGAGTVVNRADADPAKLQRDFDVVLLDWSQDDGVMRWFRDKEKCSEADSPLGPRAQWHTPTVLLGSAGLNLACVWEVKGGSG